MNGTGAGLAPFAPGDRDGSQLHHQAEQVEFDPVLRDLAVFHTVEFDRCEGYVPLGWGNALEGPR